MKRKFQRRHRLAGKKVAAKQARHLGKPIARAIHQGGEVWPNEGIERHDVDGTFPVIHRIVEDDGRKWFEVAFIASQLMQGDAVTGWSDEDGYIYTFFQYSEDLVAWSNIGFLPAQATARPDGTWEHWARAALPVNASPKTGAIASFSTDANGDSRNNPFTGLRIGGIDLDLPNFPYTMPGDAAQMQTDIRAAGYPNATVTAASDIAWQILIPDVEIFEFQTNSFVSWPPYQIANPIMPDEPITIQSRMLVGDFFDIDGNRVVTRAFARLGILPGARYGTTAAPAPARNPTFVDLAPLLPPSTSPGTPISGTPGTPYLAGGQDIRITGSHSPGSTLTRPEITWVNTDSSDLVVVRQWFLNGEPTGESGPTFSATTDGDLVQYIETASNDLGESTQNINWPRFPVSAGVAAHQAEAHTEMQTLTDGLPGGLVNMAVFSAFDHAAQAYTRNLELWAAPLVAQLAACVAWKSMTRESYGGVLISPRHVLYCHHAHPHAESTWIFPKGPETIRFVLPDNSVVNAIQICQTSYREDRPGYLDPLGYVPNRLDLVVATLDRDMTDYGIHPIPIPLMRSPEEWTAFAANGVPRLAVSQGVGRPTSVIPPEPISDYPQYHPAMVYIRTPSTNSLGADAPYDLLDYRVWDGDSGTPAFLLHRGQLYLEGILVSTPWGRVPAPIHAARINEMIIASDNGAVTLGRLSAPTGLAITPVPLPTD
jgi:hypothetical protein